MKKIIIILIFGCFLSGCCMSDSNDNDGSVLVIV